MRTVVPWEELQARLVHLGVLAEELPEFVARPVGAWLFREIAREAGIVVEIAAAYVAEAEAVGLTTKDATTPPPMPWRYPTGAEADQAAAREARNTRAEPDVKPSLDEGTGPM